MQKIRFIDSNFECNVSLKLQSKRIICTFNNEEDALSAPLSEGFMEINEHNGFIQSDYSKYKYVYKESADKITFVLTTDENDVYVEPEIPEYVESKPYVPTEEELQSIFERNKVGKVNQSKILLATYLEEHPLVSDCHGGVEATYTVTSEKQSLMASNYLTYTIAKESGVINPKLTWNAAGCECEEWTEEEYVILVLQISEYVKPLVSLQQSYEVAINSCTNQEELDAIEISYDVVYG